VAEADREPTPAAGGPGLSGAAAELERSLGALGDPTRRAILLDLLGDPTPRTVDEVAGTAGVHRTVAFGHLERLSDLGFLVKSKRRGRLGKPAALYAAGSTPVSLQFPARQSTVLAGLLAAGLAEMGEPGRELARSVGRRFGSAAATGPAGSVAEALAPLQALGGDYRVRGTRIDAGNCVFREACAAASAVVCGLHAGILEGALRGAGIDVRVVPAPVEPPAGCTYRVTTEPAAPAA
jgi:predicted ArsR family transcriptional regulator